MNCSNVDLHLPAYVSHELDSATAEEIERHLSGCAVCSAKLETQRSITQSLIALGVCSVPPETDRALRKRLEAAQATRRSGYRFRAWALAGALVAAVMAVGLFFSRQEPVTAAQVLAHARAAATKYKSWHIVYRINAQSPGRKDVPSDYEEWYRAPDMLRDYHKTAGQEFTLAVRGSVSMTYDSYSNIARLWPMARDEQQKIATRKITISLQPKIDLPRLRDPHLTGTTFIRGRTCDVVEGIEIRPGRQQRTRISYAVDRETGLVMRKTYNDTWANGHSTLTRDTIRWELDKPIADSVFDIKIPSGALVIKGNVMVPARYPKTLTPVSRTQQTMQGTISMVQEFCPRGGIRVLYAPAQIPGAYRFIWGCPSSIVDGRCEEVQLHYINPSTGDTIVLKQSQSQPDEQGEAVTDGGFSGRIFTGDVPYPYAVLTWQKGKFYFTMTASSLAKQKLIHIAQSLQPVPARLGARLKETQVYPPAADSTNPIGPKPVSHAATLEFYYLKDIWGANNPHGKWVMHENAGAGYSFTDTTGKSFDSSIQPKLLLNEIAQPAKNKPILTSRDVLATATVSARPSPFRKGETEYTISVSFTPDGTKKLADFTRTHRGRILAIFYRGKLLMAPRINDTITDGKVVISGLHNLQDAKSLVDAINSDRAPK